MKILLHCLILLCASTLFPLAAGAADRIRIAYVSPSLFHAIPWIGRDTGIFRKHGFDSEVVLITGSPRVVQTLLSGDIEYAVAGATPAIRARMGGANEVYSVVETGQGRRTVMLKNEEREILKRFKAEVESVLGDRLDRVVLFGSRSRGDGDPDSDFDLLVTVQSLQETHRNRVLEVAADLSLEYGVVLAVLVVPTNDFREDRYFYLYENIQKEGQVV